MTPSSLLGTDYIIARCTLYYKRYLSRPRRVQCDIRQLPFVVVCLDHAEKSDHEHKPLRSHRGAYFDNALKRNPFCAFSGRGIKGPLTLSCITSPIPPVSMMIVLRSSKGISHRSCIFDNMMHRIRVFVTMMAESSLFRWTCATYVSLKNLPCSSFGVSACRGVRIVNVPRSFNQN